MVGTSDFADDAPEWTEHKSGLGIDGDERNLSYIVLADSEADFSGYQGRGGGLMGHGLWIPRRVQLGLF